MDKKTSLRSAFIIWNDACSTDDWLAIDEAKKSTLARIHTLGFIVNQTDDNLIVALNHDISNNSVSQFITIPKPWILSFVEFDYIECGEI